MVAAYFRFPLGVYALTTARSTGTPQISGDYIEAFEFGAVPITSSSSPLICNPNPRQQLGTQQNSNLTCLHKTPAPILPLAHPRAQQTVSLRMLRELEQQQSHPGQIRNWPRYVRANQSLLPKQKQHGQTSHSAIFHNHVFASSPSWPRRRRRFRPPFVAPLPCSPKNLRSAASCTHVPACSSTSVALAPLNGLQKSAWMPTPSPGRPASYHTPCPRIYHVPLPCAFFQPLANE